VAGARDMRSRSFEVRFDAPTSAVWRIVSDTDRVDGAAGLGAIAYTERREGDGTTRRFGRMRKYGMLQEYEEKPFVWVHERFFEVERVFSRGVFRVFRHRCEIVPDADPDAGCTVRTTYAFEGRGLLGLTLPFAVWLELVLPYRRVYRRIREALAAGAAPLAVSAPLAAETARFRAPVPVAAYDTRWRRPRVRALVDLAARARAYDDSALVARIVEAVTAWPDEDLWRMQPRALARRWQADPKATLDACLAATRAGLLKMRWDVICPHCRGDKGNLASLADATERAYCPSCDLDFDVDLDRGLEAVFTPHPQVREVVSKHFCVAGPGSTPHIVYQRALEPGEADAVQIALAPGRYRARFTGETSWRWISVEADGASHVRFVVGDAAVDGTDAIVGRSFDLEVRNASGRRVVAVVESVAWAEDALSAGELVADQRFRDLFSKEVLGPGTKLAVQDATLLFTDVVGSTALYNTLGDARAFRLVHDHFGVLRRIVAAHKGAIVKTIGDAVMAVFVAPDDALRAAAALHVEVDAAARASGHEAGVRLKVGVHAGPCIAVTLNERLDYFGTTVNLAARAEHLAGPGEIVVTEDLARRTRGGAPLSEAGWTSRAEEANPKGFPHPIRVLRWSSGPSSA